MTTLRIVVSPMHDRDAARIVHHLAPDFDTISRLHRDARRDADIVDDLHRPGSGLDGERFVLGSRVRAKKIPGTLEHASVKCHLGRSGCVVSGE